MVKFINGVSGFVFILIVVTSGSAFATCHDRIAAAEAQFVAVPDDHKNYKKLKKMIGNAKAAHAHGKKKKKCKKIAGKIEKLLAKTNANIRKNDEKGAKKKAKAAECEAAIAEVEGLMLPLGAATPKYQKAEGNVKTAKGYLVAGKYKKCMSLMGNTADLVRY